MAALVKPRRRTGARAAPGRRRASLDHCAHNCRAAIEELLLVERHLSDPDEWCPWCLRKHLLTVAALGAEGARLTGSPAERRTLAWLAQAARRWAHEFVSRRNSTLNRVRATRQALMKRYYGRR